ncbi:urease accessory protein UreE [Microbulbifer rhizosphaerae]|uniref:Urease accessory protein UreE n=1 Tax=Microbulbifer rhizosphaerae TaxID=1562603 RepID=A0A7W4Z8I7_9GAMM|nr:urease accessory protein UreE [Microbulbifer rhizosphaerae]MBB3059264.1 urease accessory protein [Microbulbifer rhizosphaerae]
MNTMLEIYQRLDTQTPPTIDVRVVLDHLQRDKGRLRVQSSEGQEVRIFLERGKPLQVGEVLRSACGRHILVEGAKEAVTTARSDDWLTFSRACYHLGNRHVKLQVGERWLRIKPDHVLEEMLVQLGLDLIREEDVFVPESGAYSHGDHHH